MKLKMKSIQIIYILAPLLFVLSLSASCSELVVSTFGYKPSKTGVYLNNKIVDLEEAKCVLSTHKIKIEKMPDNEILVLSSIIQDFDFISANNSFGYTDGSKVRYLTELTDYYAQQSNGPIEIGPKAAGNFAVYTHELGHIVGNREIDNHSIYGLYNKAVPVACHPTRYSKVSHGHGARNEEFAEVFAAFVLAPKLLENVSESCNKAADFMKTFIFSNK